MPVIPATQEAELRRIMVPGQPGQKVCVMNKQQKKLGVGNHACHPSSCESHK
jgi:hypothetical protein